MLSSPNPDEPLPKDLATLNPWARRLLLLCILLISVILIGILFWLMSFLIVPILIVLVAALLAYALVPVIDLLHRVMPRPLTIVLVYVVATVLLALLAYLGVKTLIPQLNSLTKSITNFVAPGTNGQDSPLVQLLKSVGFTQSQIDAASKQLQSQISSIASNIAKGTLVVFGGLISAGFNILITVVVSIYLLVDGYRFGSWLINSSPISQRGLITIVLESLQRVVGGYIRGQFIMSAIIGVLQGVGMAIIGVPFALFIGVLAAVMEFVPNYWHDH